MNLFSFLFFVLAFTQSVVTGARFPLSVFDSYRFTQGYDAFKKLLPLPKPKKKASLCTKAKYNVIVTGNALSLALIGAELRDKSLYRNEGIKEIRRIIDTVAAQMRAAQIQPPMGQSLYKTFAHDGILEGLLDQVVPEMEIADPLC